MLSHNATLNQELNACFGGFFDDFFNENDDDFAPNQNMPSGPPLADNKENLPPPSDVFQKVPKDANKFSKKYDESWGKPITPEFSAVFKSKDWKQLLSLLKYGECSVSKGRWVRASTSGKGVIYWCDEHELCRQGLGAKRKIDLYEPTGTYELFSNSKAHSGICVPCTKKNQGVRGTAFASQVYDLLDKNNGPKCVENQIVNEHWKPGTMEEVESSKADLPKYASIRSFSRRVIRQDGRDLGEKPDFSIIKNWEAWCEAHAAPKTLAEFEALEPTEWFVLAYSYCPHYGPCVALTNRICITRVFLVYKYWKSRGGKFFPGKCDGSFNREKKNYVTCDFGFDVLNFDMDHIWKDLFDNKRWPRHSYQLYMYSTCMTESKHCYFTPLKGLVDFCIRIWDIQLPLNIWCIDQMRSLPAAMNDLAAKYPFIVGDLERVLFTWDQAHCERTWETAATEEIADKDLRQLVSQVHWKRLKICATEEEHSVFADLLTKEYKRKRIQNFTARVRNLLTGSHTHYFNGACGIDGILPITQSLERLHSSDAETVIMQQSHEKLLTVSIPKLLTTRSYHSKPVKFHLDSYPTLLVRLAFNITFAEKYEFQHIRFWTQDSTFEFHYVNDNENVLEDVTEERIKLKSYILEAKWGKPEMQNLTYTKATKVFFCLI